MSETKNEKPRQEIDLDVFEVSACKDKSLQPFFNVFHYHGGNYAEQKLGDLFGVIQIFDQSKNSAYLANVISQVIKKEFFCDTKKSTEKAFEASLHKANLALTDLAQHEIVEWMGKLNAVVGVIQKNNFHFTQAGGGRILLIRNKLITDVSRGLDDGEGIDHPIKTFSNISSGSILPEDKLMFCTETVFDAVKWEELKRHTQTFNSDELDNIFRATLMTEGDQAGAVVINARHKEVQSAPVITQENSPEKVVLPEKNYFGADPIKPKPVPLVLTANEPASQKDAPTPDPIPASQPHDQATINKNNDPESTELQDTPIATHDHPDEQAPLDQHHELYIKEETPLPETQEKQPNVIKERLKELSLELRIWFKDHWPKMKRKMIIFARKTLIKLKTLLLLVSARLKMLFSQVKTKTIQYIEKRKSVAVRSDTPATTSKQASPDAISGSPLANPLVKPNPHLSETAAKNAPSPLQLILSLFASARMKKRLAILSIIIAGAGSLTFFAYSINTNTNDPDNPIVQGATTQETPIPTPQPKTPPPASNTAIDTVQILNEEVHQLIGLRGELFMLGNHDNVLRYNIQDKVLTKIELPAELKGIVTMASMPDLKLIFFITPTKVYSYSPIVNKFESNTISLPESADIAAADTYMTYLYLLDRRSNMIYRYSRATGGFGDRKAWLEKDLPLNKSADMTIDGSIFLSFQGGTVKKLFNNQEVVDFQPDIALSDSSRIATSAGDNKPVYVLDSGQSKVIELTKSGTKNKEFTDISLQDAKDLWIENKDLYILNKDNQLLRINL